MMHYGTYNVYIDGSSLLPPITYSQDPMIALGQKSRRGVEEGNAYNWPVEKILDDLDKDGSVARILLKATSATGSTGQQHKVVIRPLSDKNKKRIGGENGWAQPKVDRDANARSTVDDWNIPGTGAGSDVDILFDPKSGSICSESSPGAGCPGSSPADTMLHELVHAVRDIQGRRTPIPLNEPGKSYTDVEEFYAILLANIDMSFRGTANLRRQHSDYSPMPSQWATSDGFLGEATHRRWVREFCLGDSLDLASQIKTVGARFNPIREYLSNPEKYR
jgi:hypothetical protein